MIDIFLYIHALSTFRGSFIINFLLAVPKIIIFVDLAVPKIMGLYYMRL